MSKQILHNPDDEIRIGLLCPAQNYRGQCRQMSCIRRNDGACSLSGAPHAAFCKIPKSHPVSQLQAERLRRDPAEALN